MRGANRKLTFVPQSLNAFRRLPASVHKLCLREKRLGEHLYSSTQSALIETAGSRPSPPAKQKYTLLQHTTYQRTQRRRRTTQRRWGTCLPTAQIRQMRWWTTNVGREAKWTMSTKPQRGGERAKKCSLTVGIECRRRLYDLRVMYADRVHKRTAGFINRSLQF